MEMKVSWIQQLYSLLPPLPAMSQVLTFPSTADILACDESSEPRVRRRVLTQVPVHIWLASKQEEKAILCRFCTKRAE